MLAHNREISIDQTESLGFKPIDFDLCSFHYQPIYCLNTGDLIMYESLLRASPEVSQSIESLIVDIVSGGQEDALTVFTLESVAKYLLEPRFSSVSFTINLEPAQIASDNFFKFITEFFSDNGLNKNRVIFEITERPCSALILNKMIDTVNALNSFGFSFALDDFGTGISNFDLLSVLDVKLIKFDRSFSKKALSHKNSHNVLVLASSFKSNFDCSVCLEGLETAEQINLAKRLGFCYGQGYGLGRPAPL
ncbi:EAL domain-containing protein [Pseudoalteromonas sp. MQS005]|uniref:EAL domain-containing protein n=1 Tax=Pseudoalteromonas sp. MQS005 TaxID=1854052 RepID=UPI0007E51F02|nr:EAL domain-containing protein [Pseudoalteromonas sp. MQS005]